LEVSIIGRVNNITLPKTKALMPVFEAIIKNKTKVGYEIPFTKLFYKYQPPRDVDEICNSIKQLEAHENTLMKELFG
jgi:hypothetical protein